MNEFYESFIEKENKRVEELMNYEIMDTPPEVELDEITKLAYIICDTPISLISLLDHTRQWFKSRHGLNCSETSKDISFCQYAIKQEELFIIEDSLLDNRFKTNPLVLGDPFIRFYAGMPLLTPSGFNIGTLCVIDKKPRTLNENQKFILKALAKQVITNFELRKYNKELIKLNEKTLKLSKAKEEFFSNMSHELRTPLNGIYGFTDILSKTKLDDEQKEHLSIVKSSVEILISIINDVLDYSKLESGKLKIENHPFNLRKLIKATYELMKIKAQDKNLSFKVNMSKNIPTYINGDKVRLNQILVNLLGNALKFTLKGSVTLNIKTVLNSDDEIEISFSVRDTGIGIPQEKLKDIFERFQQIEGTTRVFGGSGLGLSISKSLVELQNGKLEVKSELDKGSEFSFSIKYQKSNQIEIGNLLEEERLEQNNNKPNFKNLRILLAEDNIINIKLIQKVLEGTGIIMETAENGKVCIEKLLKNNYDIILMDLYMPEMDGYAATKHIRNIMNINTPIIGLSANISELDKRKCLELGMNEYVTKPFKIEELYSSISKFSCKGDKSKNILLPLNVNMDLSSRSQKIHLKTNKQASSIIIRNPWNFPHLNLNENTNKIKLIKPKHYYSEIKNQFNINPKVTTASSLDDSYGSNKVLAPKIIKISKIKKNCNKINIISLKEYSGNDEDFEKQIIETFLEEIPLYLKELEIEIRKQNFDAIKKTAHKIKSPLGIFGLKDTLNKFQKIEEFSLNNDLKSITKYFDSCKSDIQNILSHLKEILKNYSNKNIIC